MPSLIPTFTSILPPSRNFNPNSIQCCHDFQHNTKNTPNNYGEDRFPEKNIHIHHSSLVPPPRPRRIILIRHGQSEGNVDEAVYTRIADPKISLTEKGKTQAEESGYRIRDMLLKDDSQNWKLYFYVSPYRRALQTLQHLARPFERSRIAGLREEPRLREQDFGEFSVFLVVVLILALYSRGSYFL